MLCSSMGLVATVWTVQMQNVCIILERSLAQHQSRLCLLGRQNCLLLTACLFL